jgi:hypothetical protein
MTAASHVVQFVDEVAVMAAGVEVENKLDSSDREDNGGEAKEPPSSMEHGMQTSIFALRMGACHAGAT